MSERDYLQPINEPSRKPSGLHAATPFARNLETVPRSIAHTDDTTDAMIAKILLDIMPDNLSNADENAEMASASQPESSRDSLDSTNSMDGAEATRQSNVWPPLEITNYSLDGWPNSNNRLANEQTTTNEWIPQTSTSATPEKAPPKTATPRDSSGSHASTSSENKNLFLRGFTPRKRQTKPQDKSADKPENPVEDNLLRLTFEHHQWQALVPA